MKRNFYLCSAFAGNRSKFTGEAQVAALNSYRGGRPACRQADALVSGDLNKFF